MSTEIAVPGKEKKHGKRKDGLEKKPSKKRQREEANEAQHGETAPTKKHKKEKKKRKERTQEEANVASRDGANVEDAKAAVQVAHQSKPNFTIQTKPPFVQLTTSFYLPLSPIAQSFPLEGLCAEHISPLLLTYHPPLKGVVLSYSNPRLSEEPEGQPSTSSHGDAGVVLSKSIDEYGVTYIWLTADFLVLRPVRGVWLEGHVNLQNESILGLICYNYFSAGIERTRLPRDWRWVGDESAQTDGKRKDRRGGEGYFVDGQGKKIDGKMNFKVKDFEANMSSGDGAGSINIFGTLLVEDEDREMDDEERQNGLVRGRQSGRRLGP